MRLLGLDHADIRVPSLAAIEEFYDALLPALGLSRKTESHIGSDGEWYDVGEERPRNVVEYSTPAIAGSLGWFVGFIEDTSMRPTATRLAFALDREADLPGVESIVRAAGGRSRMVDRRRLSSAVLRGSGRHATRDLRSTSPRLRSRYPSRWKLANTSNRRDETSMTNEDLYSALLALNEATEAGFQRNDGRFDAMDVRFGQTDRKLDGIDARLGRVETHVVRLEIRGEGVERELMEVRNSVRSLDARLAGVETGLTRVEASVANLTKRRGR